MIARKLDNLMVQPLLLLLASFVSRALLQLAASPLFYCALTAVTNQPPYAKPVSRVPRNCPKIPTYLQSVSLEQKVVAELNGLLSNQIVWHGVT